jgi:hypothetical protein
MSCLGVYYSLSEDEVRKLKSFQEDSDRLDHLQCEIEEAYFSDHEDRMAQSDKAWDAMHRTLSGGTLTYDTGPYPLRLAVIGGEPIYAEGDYIMSLKKPSEVRDVAQALPAIKKDEFRRNYDAIDPKAYGFPKSDEDFEYTWEWFTGVVTFYQKAAGEGRWVLFTADQ